jgi:hypothetical protein
MHISIPIESTIELLNFTPINPLISKCEIKVCYVGEDPNRNRSIITKPVATEMAKTLPGSPIVGFYNKEKGDFEEHNRMIDVSNGKFNVIDTTRPYGFVDLGAKVWFQKFLDDGIEHEYLMTEGYVWSDIYPESKRIVEKGNNQSMELHNKLTKGTWTTDDNGNPKFFIINEAIISKLCILGEDVEPCFEGAGIAAQFSIDGDFKEKMFSMIEELKTALQEGGATHMENNENIMIENENQETEIVLDNQDEFKKKSKEEEEEDEEKKPPFPPKKDDEKSESEEPSDDEDDEDDDEEKKKKKKMNHAKEEEEDEEKCPECGKPKSECTCEDEKKKKYNLEEIPEYVELAKEYALAIAKVEELENEIKPLREFKSAADKKEKEDMIKSFYMLSDEDKADVLANIDTYSLDDIEAKLAILCVRNKVNFNLDEDNKEEESEASLIYNVTAEDGNDNAPAWIKAVRDTAKNMI